MKGVYKNGNLPETEFKSAEYLVFDPRGSRQMDVQARPLGLLLTEIKFKEDLLWQ